MHEPAQFFVGWGTLSLINAGLAQSKGRSGFLWWLISLLLGPIATLLIVVLSRVPPVTAGIGESGRLDRIRDEQALAGLPPGEGLCQKSHPAKVRR